MPKVGGRRKKVRSHKQLDPVEEKQMPKTFVFKKGKVSDTCKDLAMDFRKCFYPNTALKLEDTNKLAIKSYLKAAKYFSVTHLIAFQQQKEKTFARFIKVGGGQILFRVMNYCRMKDVLSNGGQPFSLSFKEPLIVLNNFAENNQVRQIGRSIQELFPNINLERIKISNVKRVMSFTYQPNKKCIYFRHYKINIKEGGVSTSFRELTKNSHKDMSQFKSFSDFLNKKGLNDQVFCDEDQQQVKLIEMGPRMKLKFISFKEGFGKIQDQEQYNGPQQNSNHKNKKSNKKNRNNQTKQENQDEMQEEREEEGEEEEEREEEGQQEMEE